MIVLYSLCTEYGEGMHPGYTTTPAQGFEAHQKVISYYPMFQDVHVMIFVGFGFLYVFLKSHSWTTVGFNYLIAAFSLQWTILVIGFWRQAFEDEPWHKIPIDITSLIKGDFGAATVLITLGVILGKCSLIQLWILTFLEIILYGLNVAICAHQLGAIDMGGSMYVHCFGTYFGLAASYFFANKAAIRDSKGLAEGDYNSQLISMVGTLFLFMFWPAANGALAPDAQQQRVIVNTVMAITASCITACAICRVTKQGLDMVVVLNATLAGGVSIGTSVNIIVNSGSAMAIGALGGIASVVGILFFSEYLTKKINLHDTCGCNNLHGLPGIVGGVVGAIAVSLADASFENQEALEATFPKLAEGRTISEQGWVQLAALGITLAISLVGGALAGFIASRFHQLDEEELFQDIVHFEEVPRPVEEIKKVEMEMVPPESARTVETEKA